MVNHYFQPHKLYDALQIKRNSIKTHLLAGGTDFYIDYLKDKPSWKGYIIDLSKISEMKKIEMVGDEIHIGAMSTFTDLAESELLQDKAPLLREAALSVGSPQIRNKGTIGGNICKANPAADGIPPLVALEARAVLQSIDRQDEIQIRLLSLEDLILSKGKTLLKEKEILTHLIFKVPPRGMKGGFDKIGRRKALAIARLNGACLIQMTDGRVKQIKLVLGAATAKPERFRPVEYYLTGKTIDRRILKKAGSLASDYVLEKTGRRPSSEYKLPVIARFTHSLIEQSLEKEASTCE